jgi:hypothetical protein
MSPILGSLAGGGQGPPPPGPSLGPPSPEAGQKTEQKPPKPGRRGEREDHEIAETFEGGRLRRRVVGPNCQFGGRGFKSRRARLQHPERCLIHRARRAAPAT